MPKGVVYLVRTEVVPDREAEWDHWHREVHVPEVLAERGFRHARRLRLVDGEETHRYWTVYDLESAEALQSYRQSPAAMRLAAQHDQKFGKAADLRRTTFEVLDDLRAPVAPSEAAVVGDDVHILLRPATTADEPAVLALLELQFEGGSPPTGFTEAQARASYRQFLGDPDAGLFLAETGGRVIGFAAATTYPTMRFGRRGHVEDLVVEEKFRTKGVGHRLLEYVERWARREGVTHLSTVIGLHREASRSFLTREGFSDASLTLRKRLGSGLVPPV